MPEECTEAIRRFLATGDYDMLHGEWPGRHVIERIRVAEIAMRNALVDAVRQRTKEKTFPALPPDFDTGQFVLGKVRPMVCGLFPTKERQVMLDLFEKALVFVTNDNIETLVLETRSLPTSRQIVNLFFESLDLPGIDGQPVGLVGFSEETKFYVSMTYFEDDNPFADWVVHEAAHVFHNWKRAFMGLPHTRARDFLLNIAFAKREVFAYACEAYARILEQARCPSDRRRLYAEYVEHWVPPCGEPDRKELVDALASAVDARNGWKRILAHCNPPRHNRIKIENFVKEQQ